MARADAEGVLTRAREAWPTVAALIGDALPTCHVGPNGVYHATSVADGAFTIRVDAVPLPRTVAARTHVNTTSGNHVIQLSDRIPLDQVDEVLAHELRVLVEVRRRSLLGQPPSRQPLLRPGPPQVGVIPRLSDDDLGLLARIDVLAAQAGNSAADEPAVRRRRDRLSGLLDDAGLRRTAPANADPAMLEREEAAVRLRLAFAERRLTKVAVDLVRQLAVPIEQLATADAQALARHRAASESESVTRTAARMPGLHPDGTPITQQELPGALLRAQQVRADVAAATVAQLRSEAARGMPRRRLMIGGGAALVAREPNVLLVNARGRWHVDPIEGLVQSVDQIRHLYSSGIGDPYQFADPQQRLPIAAIRLWQDTLAVRGPIVDGHADLQVDERDRLIAVLRPADGSSPLRIDVDGEPLVATGVLPEIVPGCAREVPTAGEAINVLIDHFARTSGPLAERASRALLALAGEPTPAMRARALLTELEVLEPLRRLRDENVAAALESLDATATWDHARAVLPGRVLFGDDIGNGSCDPRAFDRWVIAGVGGAAIANAEIILRGNPHATVAMVGSAIPWVLQNDAQYLALRRRHDATLGGDGRLLTHTGHRLGPVVLSTDADGVVRPRAAHVQGDAYVACLGRIPRLPPILDSLRTWARQHNGTIRGQLLFDDDRQYVGYRLTFRARSARHAVTVTGAASRMPPPDVFSAVVNAVGLLDAPPESGNVATGFMATAQQAARLAFPHQPRPAAGPGLVPPASPEPGSPRRGHGPRR